MKILALDSSGLVASVALLEDQQAIGEYTINYKKTHSQTLLPMLDELSKQIELDLNDIDAIASAAGPGSFTGLRIGAATAKGLGLALGKPLVSVPTVDGMAFQMFGAKGIVCPILDARRSQVYTGIYEFTGECGDTFEVIEEQMAISLESLVEKLNQMNRPVIFLGDGVPVHQETLKREMRVPISFAPSYCNRQRAASVGALAMKYYEEGKVVSAKEFKPEYLRETQAERERKEREENDNKGSEKK